MTKIILILFILLPICIGSFEPVYADGYLTSGEVVGITSATMVTSFSGYYLKRYDSTRTSLIKGPLPLDNFMLKVFGGSYSPGKTNFLDNNYGSAFTPVTCATLLTIADLSYADKDKEKQTLQDLFLFTSGIITTKGVTDIAKGIFTRPRPYQYVIAPDERVSEGFLTDRSSFFSGHTSGAFFSVSFLNMRIRSIMRSEMSPSEYKNYRWISPTLLYSWATFVGLSRIHAYKHYFSDILFGAITGYLMAELFYAIGDSGAYSSNQGTPSTTLFSLNFSF